MPNSSPSSKRQGTADINYSQRIPQKLIFLFLCFKGTSSTASTKSATIEMYTGSSSVGGGIGGYAVAVDSTLDTLSSMGEGEGESEKSGSYVSGGSQGVGPVTHTVIPPPPRGHFHHHGGNPHLGHHHHPHHHTLSHYNPGQHRHPPPSHTHVLAADDFDEVS